MSFCPVIGYFDLFDFQYASGVWEIKRRCTFNRYWRREKCQSNMDQNVLLFMIVRSTVLGSWSVCGIQFILLVSCYILSFVLRGITRDKRCNKTNVIVVTQIIYLDESNLDQFYTNQIIKNYKSGHTIQTIKEFSNISRHYLFPQT